MGILTELLAVIVMDIFTGLEPKIKEPANFFVHEIFKEER
jgi:hypothetical protein